MSSATRAGPIAVVCLRGVAYGHGDGKWGTYVDMAREVLTQVTIPPFIATLDVACCLIHLPTQALTTLTTTQVRAEIAAVTDEENVAVDLV